MKKFTILFTLLFYALAGKAQNYAAFACSTPTASGIVAACQPTDPSVYGPVAHDTVKIYLNFIFTKPTGTVVGIFDTIGPGSVRIIVEFMNQRLDSLYAAQLIHVPPAAYIKKTWIKLVTKSIVHLPTPAYSSGGTINLYPNNGAININYEITNGVAPIEGFAPITGHEIGMIYPAPTPTSPYTSLIDGSGAGGHAQLLLHEIGHAMGLHHTIDSEVSSNLVQGIDDYFVEDSTIWAKGASCGTLTTTHSNNIMAYNYNCKSYLSPKQIGEIYYCLNTGITTRVTNKCIYDTSKSVRINSTQTWTVSKFISGNLIVRAGNKLTIKCRVAMAGGAKVIVEPNAVLTIDGGEITAGCDGTWGGIEVAGTTTLAQSYNTSTGFATHQGVLNIINGGTLSRSGNAVKNYTIHPNGALDWASTGGIILANNAIFQNNVRDVEFQSYPGFPSLSYFYDCLFLLNDSIGWGQKPFARVSMWHVTGVKFLACNFEVDNTSGAYTYPRTRGIGIFTGDASYSVDQACNALGVCTGTSTFTGFDVGIEVANVNPLWNVSVSNTQFTTQLDDGILFSNMNSFVLRNNVFENKQIFTGGGNGLYLYGCKNYTVKNNTFFEDGSAHLTTGLYVYASESGSHAIYRNNFHNMHSAINAVGDNNGGSSTSGLLMNCNTFTAVTTTNNRYDIALMRGIRLHQVPGMTSMVRPTVMPIQGYYAPVGGSARTLVRNQYGATCGANNKWSIDTSGRQAILHTNNTTAVTSVTPHPGPGLSACSPTLVGVLVAPAAFTYSLHCPPGNDYDPAPRNGTLTLYNGNAYIQAAIAAGSTDHFGMQAAMAAKLNVFMSDSVVANADSVIQTLDYNVGSMDDADILTVFAYMAKGDYTNATTKANALGTGRADWKALLLELITIYQEPNNIYSVNSNSDYKNFLRTYANTDGMDGQIVAQSLLRIACDTIFDKQRPLPDDGSPAREMSPASRSVSSSEVISIYPNPTQNGVTVNCNGYGGSTLLLEVKDLLGRIILTKFISGLSEQYISTSEFRNGVYLFSISKDKEIIYSTKIVKQD